MCARACEGLEARQEVELRIGSSSGRTSGSAGRTTANTNGGGDLQGNWADASSARMRESATSSAVFRSAFWDVNKLIVSRVRRNALDKLSTDILPEAKHTLLLPSDVSTVYDTVPAMFTGPAVRAKKSDADLA